MVCFLFIEKLYPFEQNRYQSGKSVFTFNKPPKKQSRSNLKTIVNTDKKIQKMVLNCR